MVGNTILPLGLSLFLCGRSDDLIEIARALALGSSDSEWWRKVTAFNIVRRFKTSRSKWHAVNLLGYFDETKV
jgi:hypothetical protein